MSYMRTRSGGFGLSVVKDVAGWLSYNVPYTDAPLLVQARRDVVRRAFAQDSWIAPAFTPYEEQKDILRLVWGVPVYLWALAAAFAAAGIVLAVAR